MSNELDPVEVDEYLHERKIDRAIREQLERPSVWLVIHGDDNDIEVFDSREGAVHWAEDSDEDKWPMQVIWRATEPDWADLYQDDLAEYTGNTQHVGFIGKFPVNIEPQWLINKRKETE